jgi:hypothetical protein
MTLDVFFKFLIVVSLGVFVIVLLACRSKVTRPKFIAALAAATLFSIRME